MNDSMQLVNELNEYSRNLVDGVELGELGIKVGNGFYLTPQGSEGTLGASQDEIAIAPVMEPDMVNLDGDSQDLASVPLIVRGNKIFGLSVRKSALPLQRFVLNVLTARRGHLFQDQNEVGAIIETLVRAFSVFVVGTCTDTDCKKRKLFAESFLGTVDAMEKFKEKEESCQPYVKYWLDLLLADAFDDVNPRVLVDSYQSLPLFQGSAKRFLKRQMARKLRRRMEFAYSLQKGAKQAWPKLPASFAVKALKKHHGFCTRPMAPLPVDVVKSLRSVSREIFSQIEPDWYTKLSVSSSASLACKRSDGGVCSTYSAFLLPEEDPRPTIQEMREKIGYLPTLHHSLNEFRDGIIDSAFQHVDEKFRQWEDQEELWTSGVNIIPEPGKFRIITKMDGDLNTALQPLQGAMLRAWKNHPASTMTKVDLVPAIRNFDSVPEMGLRASVDYSSATDTLSLEATREVLSHIPHSRYSELGKLSIQGGKIVYPGKYYASETDSVETGLPRGKIERTAGQMMGHSLSFPALCSINLSVWRLALARWAESHDRAWDEDRAEEKIRRTGLLAKLWNLVLVNGDDMVAPVDLVLYGYLLQSAQDHGFILSPGKNYLSADSQMINSQTFIRVNDTWQRVGYLNQRIVTGSSPKSGESRAHPIQVARAVTDMCTVSPIFSSALPEALGRIRFSTMNTPVNWFLPVHLGGLGVPIALACGEVHLTRQQRLLAAHFINHPDLTLFRMISAEHPDLARGVRFDTDLRRALVPASRLVSGDYCCLPHESSTQLPEALERLCVIERYRKYGTHAVTPSTGVTRFRCPLAQVGTEVDPEAGDTVSYLIREIRRDYRLRPMSSPNLISYWHARVISSQSVAFPPLPLVRPSWQLDLGNRQGGVE